MAATFPTHIDIPKNEFLIPFPTTKSVTHITNSADSQIDLVNPAHEKSNLPTINVNHHEMLSEIKALLQLHRDSVPHFTLTPTRTVTWTGDVVAYKVRPLLADEAGRCLTIRIDPAQIEEMILLALDDEDLEITKPRVSKFLYERTPSVPVYRIALAPDSAVGSPMASPRRRLHTLSPVGTPKEERVEPDWMENEGWTIDEDGNMIAAKC